VLKIEEKSSKEEIQYTSFFQSFLMLP